MTTTGFSIITIVVIAISIILLPYLWYKYYTLRKHFLISARFPLVSIFASICIFVCSLCTALNLLVIGHMNLDAAETLLFPISNTIANITAFVFCTAILWRTLLIYDAWMMTKYTLKYKTNIILSADFVQDTTYTMYRICGSFFIIYHKRLIPTIGAIFIILVLIVSICTNIFILSAAIIPTFLFLFSWVVVICMGIMLIIKARKVKDAVFCIGETYFVIFMIFVQLVLVAMPPLFAVIVGYFVDTILCLFSSYVVIMVPLLMIYRNEGTLTSPKILKPHLSHHSPQGSNRNSNTSTNVASAAIIKQKRLYEYLNDDISAYNEFAEFLTQCFALENLLFYAKVLVFRQVLINSIQTITKSDDGIEIIVMEQQSNRQKTESETVTDDKRFIDKWCPRHLRNTVYAVKFTYLDGLYESCSPVQNMNIRHIAENIYDQYIASTAINEVNISSYHKNKLLNFFTSKDEHDEEKYLSIFNGAIEEIYDVLDSVYRFKYKSIKKNS